MNTFNKKLAMMILPALMLSGCGGGLSGTYSNKGAGGLQEAVNGATTFTFKGNTVEIKIMGKDVVGSYEVKDGKVYLTGNGRTEAYEIDDKGCILLGPLGRACKQS